MEANGFRAANRQGEARKLILDSVAVGENRFAFDLFDDLCPDESFVEFRTESGVEVRPDGSHFGNEGSRWWADRHAAFVVGPP